MQPSNASALTVTEDGATLLAACAEFTVYWRGSMRARAAALVALYRHALGELKPTLRFFETGTMSGAKRLKADTLDMIPFWLEKAKPKRDIYMLSLESGNRPNEPSDRAIYFVADEDDGEPLGAMRVSMPLQRMETNPAVFAAKVADWVGNLDFESGHAGYGINWDPRGDSAIDAQAGMARIAARYHGVDLFDFDVTLVAMRKTRPAGIKRVGWITLVGKEVLDSLGGLSTVAGALGDAASMMQLPGGVLIQAGPAPQVGDTNRNEDMSSYRAVGRLLAPHRFADHRPLFGSTQDSPEDETERWLARFDR